MPEPSKEELERICQNHGVQFVFGNQVSTWSGSFLRDVLAWATGKKGWCSHVTLGNLNKLVMACHSDNETYPDWFCPIGDDWDICPVKGCHAKRPE